MGGEQSVPVVNRTSLYHDEKKVDFIGITFNEVDAKITQDIMDNIARRYGLRRPRLLGQVFPLDKGFLPIQFDNAENTIVRNIIYSKLGSLFDLDKKKNVTECKILENIIKNAKIDSGDNFFSPSYKKFVIQQLQINSISTDRALQKKFETEKKIKALKDLKKYMLGKNYIIGVQNTLLKLLNNKLKLDGMNHVDIYSDYKTSDCVVILDINNKKLHITKPSYRIVVNKNDKGEETIEFVFHVLIRTILDNKCNYTFTTLTFTEDKNIPQIYTVELVLNEIGESFKEHAIQGIGKEKNDKEPFNNYDKISNRQLVDETNKIILDLLKINLFKTKFLVGQVFNKISPGSDEDMAVAAANNEDAIVAETSKSAQTNNHSNTTSTSTDNTQQDGGIRQYKSNIGIKITRY